MEMKVKMKSGIEVDTNKEKLVCKVKGAKWVMESGNGKSGKWKWVPVEAKSVKLELGLMTGSGGW